MKPHWSSMLVLAVRGLGLTPDAFWRLSLAEWIALTGDQRAAGLDRGALRALLKAYPDQEKDAS